MVLLLYLVNRCRDVDVSSMMYKQLFDKCRIVEMAFADKCCDVPPFLPHRASIGHSCGPEEKSLCSFCAGNKAFFVKEVLVPIWGLKYQQLFVGFKCVRYISGRVFFRKNSLYLVVSSRKFNGDLLHAGKGGSG